MAKHKHYDLIVAWAEGKSIQYKWNGGSNWQDCGPTPCWYEDTNYRIKPEPKPDVVYYTLAHPRDGVMCSFWEGIPHNLKLTFDGETGKLKSAEVLDMETTND